MTMTPCNRRPAMRAVRSLRLASAARLGRSHRRDGPTWVIAAAMAAMLSAGLPVPAAAQGAKPALDHEDTYRWNTIRSPRISADGAWAAWVVEPWDGDPELVVSRTDGTASRRVLGSCSRSATVSHLTRGPKNRTAFTSSFALRQRRNDFGPAVKSNAHIH